MVKSGGYLKKLKNLGKLIGKGANWVNQNIVKPLNPLIDTALDFVPYGNTIKNVKNTVTRGLDLLDNVDDFRTTPNRNVQRLVDTGSDIFLDTQRSKRDRKYDLW